MRRQRLRSTRESIVVERNGGGPEQDDGRQPAGKGSLRDLDKSDWDVRAPGLAYCCCLNAQSRRTSPAAEQEEKVRQGVREGDESPRE